MSIGLFCTYLCHFCMQLKYASLTTVKNCFNPFPSRLGHIGMSNKSSNAASQWVLYIIDFIIDRESKQMIRGGIIGHTWNFLPG